MRKFVKSLFSLFALFCFLSSVAFCSPEDELNALYKDMNKVNNGRTNLFVTGQAMDYNFNLTSKMAFESRPKTLIRGEFELVTTPKQDAKKAKKTAYEFFVEDSGKEYTYYYTEKGKNKWYKDVVTNDDVKKEKSSAEVALDNLDPALLTDLNGKVEYDTNYTSTAGKGDETAYKVTFDMQKFAKLFSAIAKEGATKKDIESIDIIELVGDNLPPLSYTVVGDTKKREIKSVHMPLTNFIKESGVAIAKVDKIEPMTKLLILAMLQDAELDIKAEGFDYNKVKVEQLPDNVKKNAKVEEKKKDKK